MNRGFSKNLTADVAFTKVKHYCAYQERSHTEVKEKLYSYGLRKTDVETLLSRLIEENYLNEERYARQFAGGKFRIKRWGRVKITYELKQKKVSPYNIRKALDEIDEADYQRVLLQLATQRWKKLKHEQHLVRQYKTQQYLQQKGFEPLLIRVAVASLRKNAEE